jgi:hypothetical protein
VVLDDDPLVQAPRAWVRPWVSRKNGPEHGSWIDEAEDWWGVLVDMAVRPAGSERSQADDEAEVRPWTPPRRAQEPANAPDPGDALREVGRAAADPDGDLAAAIQRALDAGVAQRDPRLVKALVPCAGRVGRIAGLKTLKAAVKAAGRTAPGADADEDVTVDDARLAVEDDWPFLTLTEGKDAAVIGGDRRLGAAERIREAFRFGTVTWEETDPRRVEALAKRIRARNVDVAILLRGFISHSEMNAIVDAAKDSDTPYVVVDSGYGVGQVRLAVERYLRARVIA